MLSLELAVVSETIEVIEAIEPIEANEERDHDDILFMFIDPEDLLVGTANITDASPSDTSELELSPSKLAAGATADPSFLNEGRLENVEF
mmetsp:Transcript_11776/g.29845  ORF Transcript_11776/g.29845 Transcript_11776/m.29845 type:complete len:90 (-) Transcript_11776:999-1268(-)